MTTNPISLRPLGADEDALLFEACMGTINWPGPRFTEDEARARGIAAVSLSVEEDNPSRFLYRSVGWEAVPGGEEDGVMLLRL